jgi:predicted 3-demethylubiquinone-9 3-methyltransferase (glyoxalase superfamily)
LRKSSIAVLAAVVADDGGLPRKRGWLTDKFGFSWQVIQMVTDKERAKHEKVWAAIMCNGARYSAKARHGGIGDGLRY